MASTTDKITETFNGQNPTSTTVTSPRSAGVFTLACANLAGWPTATKVHFATYKIDTSSKKIAGSQIDMSGIVSGTNIGSITILAGTDSGNAIGDVVEMMPTASWAQDLAKAIELEHLNTGAHGAITPTSVTSAGTVQGATVVSTGDIQRRSVSTETMDSERFFDHVASGCVITGTGLGTTLGWSMTSGVVYIGGKRLTVASASGTVTASKDTYFDLLDPGAGTVATLVNTSGNIVANNAASPALAASSVRIGIVVSAAGSIADAAKINQGQEDRVLPIASSVPYAVTDSLGNLICPRDPNRKLLGQKIITAGQSGISTEVDITGLAVPVIATSGRKIMVTISISSDSTAADTAPWLSLKESTTYINGRGTNSATGNTGFKNIFLQYTFTPTSGLHTYKAAMQRFAGAGTVTVEANAAAANTPGPAYIRVEQL